MAMRDAAAETLCARLCLLTRAVGSPSMPMPFSRKSVRRLYESGALSGLVLREGTGLPPKLTQRARELLTRSGAIYDLLRGYRAQGYHTLLPEDRFWPSALLALGEDMPLFLFARGNLSLLGGGCVAVAGSRQIGPETEGYARRVGERIAAEGLTMVCGGAQGVDHTAQEGLLRAGGRLILVPAIPAGRHLADPLIERALADGRLLLLVDALPEERFSPYRALLRNGMIYALGGASLVLAARRETGGSWDGASRALRGGYTPVFVPADVDTADQAGCRALTLLGARAFSLGGAPLRTMLFEGPKKRNIQTKPKEEDE